MSSGLKRMFGLLFLVVGSQECFSQVLSVRAGQTLIPGAYAGIHYSHYTNSGINFGGGLFFEGSRKNNLHYTAYGADFFAEYQSTKEAQKNLFGFGIGLGTTCQVDNDPWVYKGWGLGQRFNYGIVGELTGAVNFTEVLGLSLFAQQKFLFNKNLGATHFIFGLCLFFHFSE